MPRFIQVNDHAPEAYKSAKDLRNVVNYVMDPQKANYRAMSIKGGNILNGCSKVIPMPFCHDPAAVSEMMLSNNHLYRKEHGHLIKHRIISFNQNEYVTPLALAYFAGMLMDLYFAEGYLACYGVHMDTDNLHMHYAVNSISMKDGYRFYIREKEIVLPLLLRWHRDYLKNNMRYWADEDRALFFYGHFSELEVPDEYDFTFCATI